MAGLGVVQQEVQDAAPTLHVLLERRLEAVHQVCGGGGGEGGDRTETCRHAKRWELRVHAAGWQPASPNKA